MLDAYNFIFKQQLLLTVTHITGYDAQQVFLNNEEHHEKYFYIYSFYEHCQNKLQLVLKHVVVLYKDLSININKMDKIYEYIDIDEHISVEKVKKLKCIQKIKDKRMEMLNIVEKIEDENIGDISDVQKVEDENIGDISDVQKEDENTGDISDLQKVESIEDMQKIDDEAIDEQHDHDHHHHVNIVHTSTSNSTSNSITSNTPVGANNKNTTSKLSGKNIKYIGLQDSANNINIDIKNKTITGSYRNDLNILYIDENIKEILKLESGEKLVHMKSKLRELNKRYEHKQTYILYHILEKKISSLRKKIKKIENGHKIKKYNESVKNIITLYKNKSNIARTIVFDDVNIEDENNHSEDDRHIRLNWISEYLKIASKYINLKIIQIYEEPEDVCTVCSYPLVNIVQNQDGNIICPSCFAEIQCVILTNATKDSIRTNCGGANGSDESIENFIRAIIRYQGLQSQDHIDPQLYIELDSHFIQSERDTGETIRQLPLNKNGRRGDTTPKMLWNALSCIGRSKYYEDYMIIGHVYWGWELPNISNLKDRMISDYIETQNVYYQIPVESRGRSSSLGTQYRLWRHLELVGHPCCMEDFKVAEHADSIRIHHELWRMMVEGTNNPKIKYI